MTEYAGREKEIEARHQKESDEYKGAVGYPSCAGCSANWPCDAAILLAQLREARKQLAAVEKLAERIRLCAAEAGSPKQAALLTVLLELDRILKGGD